MQALKTEGTENSVPFSPNPGTRVTSAMAIPAASRAFEWAVRVLLGSALDMIFSVLFMPLPKPVETTVVRDREATVRLVLDHGWPTGYPESIS